MQCFILYSNTRDEVSIYSRNDTIGWLDFKKSASGWVFPSGIKIGMQIETVVSLNQKNFNIYGFEWDDGYEVVDWKGGKLSTTKVFPKFSVRTDVDQNRKQK